MQIGMLLASIMLNAPKDLTSKRFWPTTSYMYVEAMYQNKDKIVLENYSKKIKNLNTF